MNVVGTTLKKVLVDLGSSVDVLFKDMLDTLKIDPAWLKPTHTPLCGFGKSCL